MDSWAGIHIFTSNDVLFYVPSTDDYNLGICTVHDVNDCEEMLYSLQHCSLAFLYGCWWWGGVGGLHVQGPRYKSV